MPLPTGAQDDQPQSPNPVSYALGLTDEEIKTLIMWQLGMVRRADFEHDVNVNLFPPHGLDPG
jgi:hypothetical protein